jgi:RNA polymerase sigma factor (sigma-70 family)
MRNAGDEQVTGVRPTNTDSHELLRRAQSGDREAADRLFAKYLLPLRRFAHRRLPAWARGALDTGDLVQDTFLNAYPRLRLFEPERDGALLSYLRRSLHNRLIDHLRRIGRRPMSTPLDERIPASTASPFELTLKHQERARYLLSLQQLRPADRQAIVARLDLGYSYEQLAVVLRKPTPLAARLAVRRALLRLARKMQNARQRSSTHGR